LRSLSKVKSARENVPSSRRAWSNTGICGAMPFSLTSQASIAAVEIAEIGYKAHGVTLGAQEEQVGKALVLIPDY